MKETSYLTDAPNMPHAGGKATNIGNYLFNRRAAGGHETSGKLDGMATGLKAGCGKKAGAHTGEAGKGLWFGWVFRNTGLKKWVKFSHYTRK